MFCEQNRQRDDRETGHPPVLGKDMRVTTLQDRFGRRFRYLRLSLTDMCNFKCSYCLPDGWEDTGKHSFLREDEITRAARAFIAMGTRKIRLTGGEPTLRKDFLQIAENIARLDGLETLALTTNGYKLPQQIQSFADAGISAINVSIDSLKAKTFADVTGHDRLQECLDGLALAKQAGITSRKINVVLMKGVNDQELEAFFEHVRHDDVALRFIELMQTGDNDPIFRQHHLSGDVVLDALKAKGWTETIRDITAGPAREFSHPDYAGRIGIIAPYSKDFCATCNRLRLTSRGELQLCLFADTGFSLRDWLQSDDQQEALVEQVHGLMGYKAETHYLHDNNPGRTPHLAFIGG